MFYSNTVILPPGSEPCLTVQGNIGQAIETKEGCTHTYRML